MKKLIALLLAAGLSIGMLAGCGGNNESAGGTDTPPAPATDAPQSDAQVPTGGDEGQNAPEAGKKVTALFFSLEGEYFTIFDQFLRQEMESKGYEYESQSCNGDNMLMCEQIENAVSAGTDMIWTWAISGEAVADTLARAREQDVLVYSFGQDPGDGSRDVFRGTDETKCGHTIAELAIEWADAKWGDAPEGTIKTLVFTNLDITQQKERTDAIVEKLSEDPRFDIMESVTMESSTVAAQSAAENMFGKYDQIDCILTPAGEMALGILAYTHSETSPVAPTDVGVFGAEINSESASYMRDGSLIGVAVNGGIAQDNIREQAEEMDKLLKGESMDSHSFVDIGKVTVDNLEEYGF